VPELTDSKAELLQQPFDGLCYTATMRWITVTKEFDWTVVHGTVLSARVGERINHAWCECGETVVDLAMPVGSRIIERSRYYRVLQPEVAKVYSADDALMLAVKKGRRGPWEEWEQLKS